MTKLWVYVTRSCPTGKRRYRSDYDAERDMKRIRARCALEGKRAPEHAYECEVCSGWHLATQKRQMPSEPSSRPRPGSRERRRRWRAALTVALLERAPECQVRAQACEDRAVDIVPLDQPDLRNPGAWVTACAACRNASTPKETTP